jgi:hypothetical protein
MVQRGGHQEHNAGILCAAFGRHPSRRLPLTRPHNLRYVQVPAAADNAWVRGRERRCRADDRSARIDVGQDSLGAAKGPRCGLWGAALGC